MLQVIPRSGCLQCCYQAMLGDSYLLHQITLHGLYLVGVDQKQVHKNPHVIIANLLVSEAQRASKHTIHSCYIQRC